MTHIISDKKVIINGMEHVVTAVDGLDMVDINNKLHYINVETVSYTHLTLPTNREV